MQLLAIGPGSGEQNKECAATGILVNEDGVILFDLKVAQIERSLGIADLARYSPAL